MKIIWRYTYPTLTILNPKQNLKLSPLIIQFTFLNIQTNHKVQVSMISMTWNVTT
jgi:hypothetical protein